LLCKIQTSKSFSYIYKSLNSLLCSKKERGLFGQADYARITREADPYKKNSRQRAKGKNVQKDEVWIQLAAAIANDIVLMQ
jgi:hypothetical protein